MKRFRLSYNRKKRIVSILLPYKHLCLLKDILPLLDISNVTAVSDCFGKYEIMGGIAEDEIVLTIEKDNKGSLSLLFLDGNIRAVASDCELSLLMDGAIRFFIAADYEKKEVQILINTQKYGNLLGRLKSLKA